MAHVQDNDEIVLSYALKEDTDLSLPGQCRDVTFCLGVTHPWKITTSANLEIQAILWRIMLHTNARAVQDVPLGPRTALY